MTRERLIARRNAAIANIAAIEAGSLAVTGNWHSVAQCLNINRLVVADCNAKLEAAK